MDFSVVVSVVSMVTTVVVKDIDVDDSVEVDVMVFCVVSVVSTRSVVVFCLVVVREVTSVVREETV